jgi:glycosyltransferase involved in cell wall biosynthesis
VDTPKVSVVIPVYNAEPYLAEAIQSILDQTFANFELLIIDDGSTDKSYAVAESFKDPRVRLFRNELNRGQSFTQNIGLKNARGEYIAILGADDIALLERLAIQCDYLDRHPETSLIGTSFYRFNSAGQVELCKVPKEALDIRWRLVFDNPIAAPTVMLRRSVLTDIGYFDSNVPCSEDLEFWTNIALKAQIEQIDIPLTKYRMHSLSLTHTEKSEFQKYWIIKIHHQYITTLAKIDVQEATLEAMCDFRDKFEKSILLDAYRVLWRCIQVFHEKYVKDSHDNNKLFILLLNDLKRLALRSYKCRLDTIRLAFRYCFQYHPASLLDYRFHKFIGKILFYRRSKTA